MYQLPDVLKSAVSKTKKTEDMLSNQMLSGIPEIDLGIEYENYLKHTHLTAPYYS